jgi:hypothetical protein
VLTRSENHKPCQWLCHHDQVIRILHVVIHPQLVPPAVLRSSLVEDVVGVNMVSTLALSCGCVAVDTTLYPAPLAAVISPSNPRCLAV